MEVCTQTQDMQAAKINNVSDPYQDLLRPFAIVGVSLTTISLVSVVITILSYLNISKLRKSIAGKMVLNIAFALLGHHFSLVPMKVFYIAFNCIEPVPLCIVNSALYGYFGTVLVFLFAAEAVHMYAKIVLVFDDIENYIAKATITAWVTPLFLTGFTTSLLTADHTCPKVPFGLLGALLAPEIIVLVFIWIIFIKIAFTLFVRSCKVIRQKKYNTTTTTELKKNFVILIVLFCSLGLPWIVIIIGTSIFAVWANFVAFVFDLIQGPILLVLMGLRLSVVRKLWKKVLCCRCVKRKSDQVKKVVSSSASKETIGV